MNANPSSLMLQMRAIHVQYDEFEALKGVDFDLYHGEIHALIGEHRAGKSTLVKLLSGAVTKDRGQILFKGQEIDSFSPQSAIKHKIAMVYQDIHVIPALNAIENIFVDQISPRNEKYSKIVAKTKDIFSRLKVNIAIDKPLAQLTQEEQIMVEIARALAIDPEIIIFDEISSKLTPTTLETLYQIIFALKKQGTGIIYISHNIDEIFEFSDRVTILKDGIRRGTEAIKDLDKVKLINLTYSFVISREELKQENKELYFFKKYNEAIIKNLPVGVIILDSEVNLYLLNYAAIQILELEDIDITNQSMEFIFGQKLMEEADEILEKIRLQEEYTWEEINYGEEKIIKINTFPFKDEYYQFLGTIILIEDISKDRYFEDYLLRTEKISSVAELAAGVAHEINNPLGIISNYINLLQKEPLENGRETLQKVEKELNRITEIVGSLLSFTKLKQLSLTPLNLNHILDEVVLLLNHKIKEKNIHFTWKKPSVDPQVMGHENKLKQVFINLIINSIEAVLEEGHIEVALSVHQKEGYVRVSVIDDGYGIPEDILDKIFDPFFSTKVNKKNSGLGLSICQHIIDSHQGLIAIDNHDQTTLKITLPLMEN